MFRHIHIRNFKSLANAKTDLGMFNVLVGANGSGKTSFLQAIELATWTVKYESIGDALQSKGIDFRDLVHLRSSREQVVFDAELSVHSTVGQPQLHHVDYRLIIARKQRPQVVLETVRPRRRQPASSDAADQYKVSCTGLWNTAIEPPDGFLENHDAAPEHSMLRDVHRARDSDVGFPILNRIAREFLGYVHFEIWGPERLRETSSKNGSNGLPALGKSGEHLAHVLSSIRRDKVRWETLLGELRAVYPRIGRIRFRRGLNPGELGLIFVEDRGTSSAPLQYRPTQMSDGFLRMLALLAIKHQPEPLSLLGYEEPENGLHPSALDDCMAHLKDIARRGTQVIVTTHSPYLLNHILEDETEPRAELRLVMRDRKGRTTIRPPDPEKVERARRHGYGLGELWGMLLDEKELAAK